MKSKKTNKKKQQYSSSSSCSDDDDDSDTEVFGMQYVVKKEEVEKERCGDSIVTNAAASPAVATTSSSSFSTSRCLISGGDKRFSVAAAAPNRVSTGPDKRPRDVVSVPNQNPDIACLAFFEHGDIPWRDVFSKVVQLRLKSISPTFEHCQIVFIWKSRSVEEGGGGGRERGDKNTCVTFSTNKELPSLYTNPSYRNKNWCGLSIPHLSGDGHAASVSRYNLFKWCSQHREYPFNTCGFYWNFVPPASCCRSCQYDSGGASFFCAEQVAWALNHVGVPGFGDIDTWSATPDSIYEVAVREGGRATVLKLPTFIFPSR